MRNRFHNGVIVRIRSNMQTETLRNRYWPDGVEDFVEAGTLMTRDVAGGQGMQQG